MTNQINKITFFIFLISLFFQTASYAQWGQEQSSKAEDYIKAFISTGMYALPYSEPLSALLELPDIHRAKSLGHIREGMLKAQADYEDSLHSGASPDQIQDNLKTLDRYQTIYSCLFQNDCSKLRALEKELKNQISNLVNRGWDFGRSKENNIKVDKHLCTLRLTTEEGDVGYVIKGARGCHHQNESYWKLKANEKLYFYHKDGSITTIFRKKEKGPYRWEGEYYEHSDVPISGVSHYLK
jgi:hypothetical protein